MKTNLLIELSKFKVVADIGYSGRSYMLKESSTGEIYAAKVFIFKEIFSYENKYKKKAYISDKINKIATLDHPSIIKFIGYSPNSFDGSSFPTIVTEIAFKGSLRDTIEANNQTPIDEWNDIQKLICIYGIAAGMTYLHSNNITFGKLCSKTIYLDDDYYPKISILSMLNIDDFYSTTNSDLESHENGSFIVNEECESIDVYNFGYIVYEIMTGLYPLENVQNDLHKAIPDDVPYAYKSLIERCWSKESKNRLSFKMILLELRINNEYIINSFDKALFYVYIDFIDTYLQKNHK